ncbi:unnamed protein product [Lota lota]
MEPRTLTPYHSEFPNITQTPDSIKDHHRLLPAPNPLRRPLLLNAQSKPNISLHKMTDASFTTYKSTVDNYLNTLCQKYRIRARSDMSWHGNASVFEQQPGALKQVSQVYF